MFRRDAKYGKDSTVVTKTANFRLPVMKKKDGSFKLQTNDYVYTCMTSDFFVEEADEWRSDAWEMIKYRSDLKFYIITKRIDRFDKCIYRDGIKPYADIDFIGGYKNKSVRSIGKLIDVVYRDIDDKNNPKYEHRLIDNIEQQKEIERRIENAIDKSKYGRSSLNRCLHTFYVTSGFKSCDFKKESEGGVLNARWFNLNEILNLTKEEILDKNVDEIAKLLSEKTWIK